MGVRMKVFISNAEADQELARRVARFLQSSGFQAQVLPGDNWGDALAKALKESQAMVVLVSPQSARSLRVSNEISYAFGDKNYKGRVVPVLTTADANTAQEMSWILKRFPTINLTETDADEGLRKIVQVLHDAA